MSDLSHRHCHSCGQPEYACRCENPDLEEESVVTRIMKAKAVCNGGATQASNALREQFNWWLQHSDEQDIPVPRWLARAWLKEQGEKS